MVAESIELIAESRESTGKKAARRLRRFDERIPGVVYGAKKNPESISLSHKDMLKALESDAIFSSILSLTVGDKKEKVVIKSLQRHPIKPKIIHIDFQRINATEKLTMNIPLSFLGEEESPGVKAGGLISHLQTEIEIRCLPANLPESIEVDLSKLELNDSFTSSDLKLPSGVELTAADVLTLVTVHLPAGTSETSENPNQTDKDNPTPEANPDKK